MKKVLMGNHAAAAAANLARAEVVAAYPITPQTQVVELLAELKARGEFKGRFIKVESEHSAMAVCVGAATAGARTFTATSSQGIAYMHEMLHWASGARLPIVMAEVNRALGAPWILWTDQTDSLSQRDTGWMQIYCSSVQEILDSLLLAYRVSEEVLLPAMVVYDGFVLSHTYETVDVPSQEEADRFLPRLDYPFRLDPKKSAAYSSLPSPGQYFRLRYRMSHDMTKALEVFDRAALEFERIFKRSYRAVEPYLCEDAETVLVTSGAAASTARFAVDELRKEGFKAGNLQMRLFRPFPFQALSRLPSLVRRLAVVDRNFSQGHHGVFFEEIKSALYGRPRSPEILGFVAGLGGGDITPELLKEIWHTADEGKADPLKPLWMEDPR